MVKAARKLPQHDLAPLDARPLSTPVKGRSSLSPVAFQRDALQRALDAGVLNVEPKYPGLVRTAIILGGSVGLWALLGTGLQRSLALLQG